MDAVSFIDLEKDPNHFLNKEISIKGFYYESDSGEALLSSQPNLKTCCLGKKGPIVLLDKNYSVSNSKPITLKGSLFFEKDDVFHLKNSQIIISENTNNYSLIIIFSLFLTLIVYYMYHKQRKVK